MFRIGIDGRALQGNRTGIGRYVFELCKELDKILLDAQFFIYSQFPIEMPIVSDRWVSRVDRLPLKRYIKSIVWLKLRSGLLCRGDNLDVFWASATFLPLISTRVKKVVTVYDLNHKVVPKTMPTATFWGYRLFFALDVNRADKILTISEGTANRLHELVNRRADGVVRPSVSEFFKPQTEQQINNCLNSYGIHYPFVLAVATWEPRKNLELLINVFISMKRDGLLPTHKLILVGGKGWKDTRLVKIVGDSKEYIISLGFVSDEQLAPLYAGSDVFVFPSVYEGFGMPVLEALSCGARVVASDIPEIREAGDVNVVYIKPDVEGIRKGILNALTRVSEKKAIDFQPPTWSDGAKTLAAALCS